MKNFLFSLLFLACATVSQAQTPCDSMDIQVKYAAFSDSLIEITVTNNGSGFYSYPGFVIFDANGDTVAKEEVVLFGMGSSSSHILTLYPGMATTSSFSGTLELWSGFYTTLECSYNMTFNLCPDSCMLVYPFIGNIGGAMSLGTVTWNIKDTSLSVVASGSFTLDNTAQMDEDTVCLTPGNYTMHISGLPAPMMGQPWFGLTHHLPNTSTPQKHYTSVADQISFPFYRKCATVSGVKQPTRTGAIKAFSHGGMIEIERVDAKPIGELEVYSPAGQLIWNGNIRSAKHTIDLNYLPSGLYLLQVKSEGYTDYRKVFLNPR